MQRCVRGDLLVLGSEDPGVTHTSSMQMLGTQLASMPHGAMPSLRVGLDETLQSRCQFRGVDLLRIPTHRDR